MRHLAMLRRALRLGAGIEITGLDASGCARKPLERPGERAGQYPGKPKPESECDRADALRYPNGAADVTPDHDRNRGVQERLAQRVAEPSALSDPPVERCRDLGPVSVRTRFEACRVRHEPTVPADDDHPPT